MPPVALPVAPVDADAGLAAPQAESDGEGAAGDVEKEDGADEEVEDEEEEATPSACAPKRPAPVPVASKGKKHRTMSATLHTAVWEGHLTADKWVVAGPAVGSVSDRGPRVAGSSAVGCRRRRAERGQGQAPWRRLVLGEIRGGCGGGGSGGRASHTPALQELLYLLNRLHGWGGVCSVGR